MTARLPSSVCPIALLDAGLGAVQRGLGGRHGRKRYGECRTTSPVLAGLNDQIELLLHFRTEISNRSPRAATFSDDKVCSRTYSAR
jgi:hypothetical protein